MNPLQYTSEEMFSSTELIRKSKMIFDKLYKNDIEKAIILRDGKPAFMLLDFSEYEKIMKEYLKLKELNNNPSIKTNKKVEVIEEEKINTITKRESELNEEDLQAALDEIDKLDISSLGTNPNEQTIEQKEALKEFWE